MFLSCKMRYYEDDKSCKYWDKRFSRSTVYKELLKEFCYYSDNRTKLKHFVFHETGCWGETVYFEKATEYYQNGRVSLISKYRKRKQTEKEYFYDGRSKYSKIIKIKKILSDTIMYDLPNGLSGYGKQIVRIKTLKIDSITGNKNYSNTIDTVPIRRLKLN